MPGTWYNQLFAVAIGQYGFVTTADARALEAAPGVLVDMERHGHVERVARGVYRFTALPIEPLAELMQATLWPRGLGIISHDSALDLWDLADVNPAKIHVTVATGARVRRQAPAAYVLHVRDLDRVEVTRHEGIPIVTPMRAILDGLERHLDRRLIDQAVATARERGLLLRDELRTVEGELR